jgi:hypothetical protein
VVAAQRVGDARAGENQQRLPKWKIP